MECRTIYRLAAILALSGLIASPATASENVGFKDIRSLAMGGTGVAHQANFNAVVFNPALLAKAGFDLHIVSLQVTASQDIKDLVEFIDDNADSLDNFTDISDEAQQQLLDDMAPFDNKWMGAQAAPQIGFATRGFALGVYGTGDVDFRVDKGIIPPRIGAKGRIDRVIVGAAALKAPTAVANILPGQTWIGGTLKIIERRETSLETSFEDADFESVVDSLEEYTTNGWGFDVGLLWDAPGGGLTLGANLVDLIGSLGDDSPPMVVNVGGAYRLSEKLTLAADIDDLFFHEGMSFFNRVYIGGEFLPAKFFALRGGFGQGYPFFGMGLDFSVLRLDAAVYGLERTDNPGGESDYNYVARLVLGY